MAKPFWLLTALLLPSTAALLAEGRPALPTRVSVQGGRLVLFLPDQAPVTVAGVSGATLSCLSPDHTLAAFLKATPGAPIATGSGEAEANQIWLLDTRTRKAKLLVASRNNPDVKHVLAGLNNPVFSSDERQVYFLSSAWAVSDAVHAVDIRTRRQRFVCDGNSVDVVSSGCHRGDLIVFKHKYNSQGAYDAFWRVSPNGTELQRIRQRQ